MQFDRFDVPRYLSVLPLFEGAAPDVVTRIAAASQLRKLGRAQTVFQPGQAADGYNVTVYGQVKLFALSAGGQEKVIELAGPGHGFGEELLFHGARHDFGAQALTDTMLLTVARDALLREVRRDADLALRMLRGLSRRVRGLMHDVQAHALHSGQQRVVNYLLSDLTTLDRRDVTVTLPASKCTIASRLSITPEYFSRVLHELESAGLIRIDGRDIGIPDPGRLADTIDDPRVPGRDPVACSGPAKGAPTRPATLQAVAA